MWIASPSRRLSGCPFGSSISLTARLPALHGPALNSRFATQFGHPFCPSVFRSNRELVIPANGESLCNDVAWTTFNLLVDLSDISTDYAQANHQNAAYNQHEHNN